LEYEKLIKDYESLKIKNENQSPEKTENDYNINQSPVSKSMAVQDTKEEDKTEKKDDSQNVNNINNIINDVNSNINDIVNKINSNTVTNDSKNDPYSNMSKNTSKEASVTFNLGNDDSEKKEKKKIDEEKKNLRLSKAMQRIKKSQAQNNDSSPPIKTSKSTKVANLAKQLENNMQRRADTLTEFDINNNNKSELIYDNGENNSNIGNDNMVNVLQNQQLTKSIKKKKTAKKFIDD